MKKTTKLTPKKLEKAIESLYQDIGRTITGTPMPEPKTWSSTNDLLKKSINAKTERSEQDIKRELTPLTVISVLNFLLLLTLVVR